MKEAVTGCVLQKKKMFIKNSQNSQKSICVGDSFRIKMQAWGCKCFFRSVYKKGVNNSTTSTSRLPQNSSTLKIEKRIFKENNLLLSKIKISQLHWIQLKKSLWKIPWLSKGLKKPYKTTKKLYIKSLKSKSDEGENNYKNYKNVFKRSKQNQRKTTMLYDTMLTWGKIKKSPENQFFTIKPISYQKL